jgi:AraC-like DNA-binding protein
MNDGRLQQQHAQHAFLAQQRELADRVARLAAVDGSHPSAFPELSLVRTSQPSGCMPTIAQPSLCVVVQGRKQALLHNEVFHYDALNYLVVSVTLPMLGQVLEATPETPYLCLRLGLDLEAIARLLLDMDDLGAAPAASDRGLYVARLDEPLLDAVLRMVRLLDTPEDIGVLADGVQREIYYRVLRGALGRRLADLAERDGSKQRVVRTIEWLKRNYAAPLRIDALAEMANMSPSALHHRFKAVTSMSPLQYQKHLRLHEARRLMFSEGMESAAAGYHVGYESPSQFSREYRRLFGAPPRTEVARLRDMGMGGVEAAPS